MNPETLLRACLDDGAFEHVRLVVRGACMRPCAEDGEAVRVVSPARRRPRFGDVVLVRTQGGLRLHRLVWPQADRARTMADRARSLDPALGPGDVLGVAVAVERDGRLVAPRRRARAARSLLRAAWTRLRRGPA